LSTVSQTLTHHNTEHACVVHLYVLKLCMLLYVVPKVALGNGPKQ